MLRALVKVAEESAVDSPFFGQAPIPEVRAELADTQEGDPKRWVFNKILGRHLLRTGHIDEAIPHYEEAYRLNAIHSAEIPRDERTKVVFDLGVTYVHDAAQRSCLGPSEARGCLYPVPGGDAPTQQSARKAIRYLGEVLAASEPNGFIWLKARWLLNLAHMLLGSYPDGLPEEYLIPPSVFTGWEEFPKFEEVAPALGLDSHDLAGGSIAEDFDNDGLLDLVVTASHPSGQMRYYRNNGDGSFTDRTREAGLLGLTGGLNCIHADYDSDGNADILVLRGGWCRAHGEHPNSLLRNLGGGVFSDVTFEAGLGEGHFPTQAADFADYDLDGDLDLYVGNEYDKNNPASAQLFRNNGDGTFTDVAEQAGVLNDLFAKSVVWGDYDDDRYPDIYVSNIGQKNRLYHNNGDGTFTDVAEQAGVIEPWGSFPSWFWDFDNDGKLDITVFAYGGRNLPPEIGSLAAGYLGLPHPSELDHFYRGDGNGGFTDVGVSLGMDWVTLPMGANYGDLNNDGYLDYYLGTAYPYVEALMPNVMILNDRARRLLDVTYSGGFGHLGKGHGVTFADLDHDGDQDVFHQLGGMWLGDPFRNALWENPGFGGQWIKIELVGVESNRCAIETRIKVEFVDDGERRLVHRRIGTGGSFGSNPLREHIGLGSASVVDSIEVYWPKTDRSQTFRDVAAGQLIEITEGHADYRTLPLKKFSLRSAR
jgi:hypothetical protein